MPQMSKTEIGNMKKIQQKFGMGRWEKMTIRNME